MNSVEFVVDDASTLQLLRSSGILTKDLTLELMTE